MSNNLTMKGLAAGVLLILMLSGCGQQQVAVPETTAVRDLPVITPEPEPADTMAAATAKPATAEAAEGVKDAGPAENEAQSYWQQPDLESRNKENMILVEKVLLPDISVVNQRIKKYEEKLARWGSLQNQFDLYDLEAVPGQWNECFQQVDRAVRGYRWLQQRIIDADNGPDADTVSDPWSIYWSDITFLESGCEETFDKGVDALAARLEEYRDSSVAAAETAVSKYAESGRYDEAAKAYRHLVDNFADWAVSPETKKIYGKALLYTGRLTEAAETILASMPEQKLSTEGIEQLRHVADIYLAAGKRDKAAKVYQAVEDYMKEAALTDQWVRAHLLLLQNNELESGELEIYRKILKKYITFDGQFMPPGLMEDVASLERDYPESTVLDYARRLYWEVEDISKKWVESRLATVNALVERKDFDRALAVIDGLLAGDLPEFMEKTVQMSKEEVLLVAEQEEKNQEELRQQDLAMQWENAVKLLESERYDDAITAFAGLLDTEYDAQAAEKISEASNIAAVNMRREAAALFIKARKTDDPDRKGEYFLESWRLLKHIVEQYPEVEIIDKVKQNLKILEEQIYQFNPGLLQQSRMDSGDSSQPVPVF